MYNNYRNIPHQFKWRACNHELVIIHSITSYYNPKQTVPNFNKNFSPVFDRDTKSTGQVSGVDWNTNEIETQFRLILDNTSCFWKAATPTNDS